MTDIFSMERARHKSAIRLLSLSRSIQQAERFETLTKGTESRYALSRLAGTLVVLGILARFFADFSSLEKLIACIAFAGLFVASSLWHRKLIAKANKWKNITRTYRLSQARILRNTETIAESTSPWHQEISTGVPKGHPYAADLDLSSSFFLLLDSCVTQEGSRHLLNLLLNAGQQPESESVRKQRQNRILALKNRTALLRELEALRFDESYLTEYFQTKEQGQSSTTAALAPLVTGRSLAIFLGMGILGIFAWFVLLLPALVDFVKGGEPEQVFRHLLAYIIVPLIGVFVFKPLVESGNHLQRRTRILLLLLNHLRVFRENPAFSDLSSIQLQAESRLTTLRRALDLLTVRNNPIAWFFLHALLPFDSLLCSVLLFQMRKTAPYIDIWNNEIEEFDAVCAFARLASEDPTCACPSQTEFNSKNDSHTFSVQRLGHPMIPASARVCNDFAVSPDKNVILLTGSNMSGKSTFLRSLGLNILLANLGAPICAERLQSVPRRILCAIRVDDSLTEGTSYFYAEVKRLKQILDDLSAQTANLPALFLVDEIFRGTNNRERFQGSWHLLHAFMTVNSIGIVSTHDLALTELDRKETKLTNKHFREHVEGDKLIFDYLLRDGPCPTTNALYIMRAAGLPIPLPEELES